MRLVTFESNGRKQAGVLFGTTVCSMAELLPEEEGFTDIGEMLLKTGMDFISRIPGTAPAKAGKPLHEVKLLAPIPCPPKIIALGLNYRSHAEEQSRPVPEAPLLFAKARTSVTGPDGEIVIPAGIKKVDLEVELAVVIGKMVDSPVDREDAEQYILGYTVINDVSARDAQFGDKQWYRGKSFRTFAPMGPVIVTKDELDWRGLELESRIDARLMQKGSSDDLIFGVDEIISYVSRVHPLEPGDVIATGTPAGVGVFRDPPVFLEPGQRAECRIGKIGSIINKVVSEN